MDEQNAPEEPPSSIEKVKKNFETNFRQDSGDISMPICFLIKEQAKSQVAIENLKKKVENIENIQDDIIDSLAHIKKFLGNESKTLSGINSTSPLNSLNPSSSLCIPVCDSPLLKETRLPSSKDNKLGACCINTQERFKKEFDSKNKESALESDKQDSGLDSDCRDNPSLNRNFVNWAKQESSDELLQLLDEISQRTQFLQKQLAVFDQNACSDNANSTVVFHANFEKPKLLVEPERNIKHVTGHLSASSCIDEIMPKQITGSCEHFENKSFLGCVLKGQKRSKNIDSAMVSSILKETSIIDLQRHVLIYLVENAVLHTKLSELEHLLHSKTLENSKIESTLKDEARLLMMENRELRISLDEQKLQTNCLKSKIVMLERVLQSISLENQELSLHLSESLCSQNLPKKESQKLSQSFTFGNAGSSKGIQRQCLPSQFSSRNEKKISCVTSKLLSNANSILDITTEEPEQSHQWSAVENPLYENFSRPVHSSTPIANGTKLKDIKTGITSPSFQTMKKCFQPTEKNSSSIKRHFSEKYDPNAVAQVSSEICDKNLKLHSDDLSAKFPFNSILEKLKENSDYRLSKRSLTQAAENNFSGDCTKSSKRKLSTPKELEADTNQRQNCQKTFHCRRGKNIHQRIQDILDRIMAESEEIT